MPTPRIDLPELDGLIRQRLWSKITIKSKEECWLWRNLEYKLIKKRPTLIINKVSYLASRLIYFLHYKENPGILHVCHSCNNKICCNPNHLYLATNEQNVLDAHRDGLMPDISGELNIFAKLTDWDVNKIRELWKTGEYTQKQLAYLFDISRSQIPSIVSGKNWKHLLV